MTSDTVAANLAPPPPSVAANVAKSLLATKLAVPPVRPNVVVRHRLLDRLRQRQPHRLTLVAAPAGFGKTTLLAGRIHGDSIPVGWVTLDSADDDLIRFWTYAIAALGKVFGTAGDVALSLLHSPQPPAIESVLVPLINGVAEADRTGILVFDDYHLVTSPAVHASVGFLIDNLPVKLQLVISTRADPPLSLARLRTRGQLTEIRADDLRFTANEAADFLHELLGPKLSAEDVAALEDRTEGWIAGLQLAALSLRGRDDVGGFVRAFTGSHHFVVDYLAQEVLGQLPKSTQTFLFDTSILDRLTGSLADAVTGRCDSTTVLECLERENLFLVALDDERSWYRYHQLFGEVLRHRLQRSQPEKVPQLHRRASGWYEENGFLQDAIKHAFAAGDWEWCAELVDRASIELLRIGEIVTVRGWLAALPESLVRSRPRLAVFQGWVLYFDGQFDVAEGFLDDAERHFSEIASRGKLGAVNADLGAVATVRAFIAMSRDDHVIASRYAQTALAQLPTDAPLRGIVTLNLGWSYWCAGDILAASQAIVESIDLSRASGNSFGTIVAMSHLAQLRMLQGRLKLAEAIYQDCLREASVLGRSLPASGIAYVGLGRIYQERNDLEGASKYLREGIDRCERLATAEITLEGLTSLARLDQARGDGASAMSVSERIDAIVDRHHVSKNLRDVCTVIRIELLLRQGRTAEALARAREWQTVAVDPGNRSNDDVSQLTRARVCLAERKSVDALAILRRIRQSAEADERWGRFIETATVEALALASSDQPTAAAELLERALALGEPEGYFRVFVDEGAALLATLESVRTRLAGGPTAGGTSTPTIGYVERIVEALRAECKSFAAPLDRPGLTDAPDIAVASAVINLGERELEVLRLIADGYSNRDIADRLVLALSTVKWYVNNIYAKLQVDSRTKAIARARTLKLLPI